MGRNRKRQPQVHAGRIVLDRRVDETVDFRKLHDLAEPLHDFRPPHAEDGATQEDIFSTGEFVMKASANLEE